MFGEIQTKICKFWRERCREDRLLGVGSGAAMVELKPIDLRWKSLWKTTKSIQKFVEREELKIRDGIERYRALDEFSIELPLLYYQIGTIAELREHHREALDSYQSSLQIAKRCQKKLPDQFYQQLLASIGRLELQESLKQSNSTRVSVQSVCLPIARLEYGSISYSEFLDRYCLPAIPVIFTSSGSHILPSLNSSQESKSLTWSLESIMSVLGDHVVTPRLYVEESHRWAKQEDGPPCKLSKILAASFPDTFPETENSSSSGSSCLPYLVDWSLPQHCPQIFDDDDEETPPAFVLPQYFAMDLLQLCPEGSLYKDTWPSLFIGPKGSQSSLHVDTFGSNFWMFLIHGTKKWRFYSPDDLCALLPSFPASFEPVFTLSQEEIEANGVQYYEVELQPGELIFVPAGSPHSVVNLQGTVAISCNYVDESNINRCLEMLGRYGLTCPQSLSLKESLERICPLAVSDRSLKDHPFWMERRERGDNISTISWKTFKNKDQSKKRKIEEEETVPLNR
jgi:hypothetical protein